jgi:TorA maturation chaperone TorD
MSTENGPKAPRIALKKPDDARRLIRRVLAQMFEQKVEVESAGKIANLLTCWAKLWELEKTADLEKRLEALEQAKGREPKR